jgi:hypothetical protein
MNRRSFFYAQIGAIGFLILFAVSVHLRFLWAVPDPIFAPDSRGYLQSVYHFFATQTWNLPSERSVGYPAFLLILLKTFHQFGPVFITQHALWLFASLFAALIYYQTIQPSKLQAMGVFFLCAILPRGVVYGHMICLGYRMDSPPEYRAMRFRLNRST